MKLFNINILKSITKEPIKPLGRWSLDYCTKKMDIKVNRSNEDHCGPCGQYNVPLNKDNYNKNNYNYSPFRVSNIDYMIYYE